VRAARLAGDDYGVTAEPDWRQVDWSRHLHQVEIEVPSLTERVLRRDDPDLASVRAHQANLWRPDPVVDPRIG
jgi:hypothetical protein